MLADTLHATIADIDAFALTYTGDPVILAQVLACRAVMDALRMRLEAPPLPRTCVPGCLRAAVDGPGHPGRCVAPPSTWPPVARR